MVGSEKFMRRAIDLSIDNVKNGGGPFGAVIVKDNRIIAEGVNRVTGSNDPTAHAEINAIRKAGEVLQSFCLSGCDIYTSCEPCPMCLGAIYWAGIKSIFYGNTKSDAAAINFNDEFIYSELSVDPEHRAIPTQQMLASSAIKAFDEWRKLDSKTEY